MLLEIRFIDNKDATRGDVCILGSQILEQYVVRYKDDSNTFENDLKVEAEIIKNGDPQKEVPYTLLQYKFKDDTAELHTVY